MNSPLELHEVRLRGLVSSISLCVSVALCEPRGSFFAPLRLRVRPAVLFRVSAPLRETRRSECRVRDNAVIAQTRPTGLIGS